MISYPVKDGKFNKTYDFAEICRSLKNKIAELHVCTTEGVVVGVKNACGFHRINKSTTRVLVYVNEVFRLSSEGPVICNGTLHTVVIY
jgi:hypothetical protein